MNTKGEKEINAARSATLDTSASKEVLALKVMKTKKTLMTSNMNLIWKLRKETDNKMPMALTMRIPILFIIQGFLLCFQRAIRLLAGDSSLILSGKPFAC